MWLQRNNQNFPLVMELFGIWLMVSFLEEQNAKKNYIYIEYMCITCSIVVVNIIQSPFLRYQTPL